MTAAPAPRHSMPFVRIELVLLSPVDGRLAVLLGRREGPPYEGRWAVPGGVLRIDHDRDLDDAARRVCRERLNAEVPALRQLRAVGGPKRDPRAPWALSVVYRGLVAGLDATPGKRLQALRWSPVDDVANERLAFDHGALVADSVARLREEVERLELPFECLPPTFTLTELQSQCEALLGRRLDKSSFRRRLDDRELVEPVVGEMRTGAYRPAQVYRARSLTMRKRP